VSEADQTAAREHVLFVVGVYAPMIGGVESHVAHLATALRAAGHGVTIATITGHPSDQDEDGIRVVRYPRRFDVGGIVAFPPLGTARRLARLAREHGVTAVSTHTRLFPMSFVGWRVARRAGVPHLHTEHGSDHVRGVSRLVGIASRIVDATMGRFILRHADRVVGVSEAVVAFVRRLAGVGADVFYNAIDTTTWRLGSSESPPTAPRRAVFVGRMVPGKGWDDFTAAFALVARDLGPDVVEGHLLGGGPDLEDCRRAVAVAGLSDQVTVHGAVPPVLVRALLANAVLVNPTQLAEGFQTTLLEALAVGAEIVSYPVPGLDALAADGAPVTVVPVGDLSGLAHAIRDAVRAPRPPMPSEQLDAWSWERRAGEYVQVIATARTHAAQP